MSTAVPVQILRSAPEAEWLKVRAPGSAGYVRLKGLMRDQGLHTVCEEGALPQHREGCHHGTATFMILGDVCTRRCGFCAVQARQAGGPRSRGAGPVADAVRTMDLRYVVITSGGSGRTSRMAAHLCSRETIRLVREARPSCRLEVLIPDFQGHEAPLRTVLDAGPDVLNTIRRPCRGCIGWLGRAAGTPHAELAAPRPGLRPADFPRSRDHGRASARNGTKVRRARLADCYAGWGRHHHDRAVPEPVRVAPPRHAVLPSDEFEMLRVTAGQHGVSARGMRPLVEKLLPCPRAQPARTRSRQNENMTTLAIPEHVSRQLAATPEGQLVDMPVPDAARPSVRGEVRGDVPCRDRRVLPTCTSARRPWRLALVHAPSGRPHHHRLPGARARSRQGLRPGR